MIKWNIPIIIHGIHKFTDLPIIINGLIPQIYYEWSPDDDSGNVIFKQNVRIMIN